MDIDIRKLAFAIAVCLLALWRAKRGFKNGILKEIVNILSGAISLVCVALVFYAVSSVMAGAMSTLTVCVIALIVLGILFKVCNLIFKPILALGDVAVVGGINKFLGAVLGLAEAGAIAYLVFRVCLYLDIYIL